MLHQKVPKETSFSQLNILFLFCFLLQIVVWSAEEQSVYWEEWKSTQEERLLHNVLEEWVKKACCFDIVEAS